MSVTVRELDCTPEQVFVALADPWVYPTWVVGASRLRAAEPSYPRPGSKLHHSIGVWPFVLDDETVVETWDPPRRMALEAKTRPVGKERVIIDVKPRGTGCVVRMEEYPVSGPARLIPKPLADLMLHIRNVETLRRLEHVARGRAAEQARGEQANSE
ncbi:SRPBCC domain-containing protein [Leifsonia sp. NPDC102414]|uniref:SRPBCC family protein n=1 Tax=Leifsonia sp. NPDC102414 TaxID=3364124 RepID=UPI00382C86B5